MDAEDRAWAFRRAWGRAMSYNGRNEERAPKMQPYQLCSTWHLLSFAKNYLREVPIPNLRICSVFWSYIQRRLSWSDIVLPAKTSAWSVGHLGAVPLRSRFCCVIAGCHAVGHEQTWSRLQISCFTTLPNCAHVLWGCFLLQLHKSQLHPWPYHSTIKLPAPPQKIGLDLLSRLLFLECFSWKSSVIFVAKRWIASWEARRWRRCHVFAEKTCFCKQAWTPCMAYRLLSCSCTADKLMDLPFQDWDP